MNGFINATYSGQCHAEENVFRTIKIVLSPIPTLGTLSLTSSLLLLPPRLLSTLALLFHLLALLALADFLSFTMNVPRWCAGGGEELSPHRPAFGVSFSELCLLWEG